MTKPLKQLLSEMTPNQREQMKNDCMMTEAITSAELAEDKPNWREQFKKITWELLNEIDDWGDRIIEEQTKFISNLIDQERKEEREAVIKEVVEFKNPYNMDSEYLFWISVEQFKDDIKKGLIK